MKKITFLLLFLILVSPAFSKELAVLTELTYPSMIETDGERLFVLDGEKVFVYSLTDYRLLTKFGKRGEGPGELMVNPDLPLTMQLFKEYVLVNAFNKMIYFSKTGEVVKELKMAFLTFQIIPLGKNYALTKFSRRSDGSSAISAILLDGELNTIKTLYEISPPNDLGKGKIAYPLITLYIGSSGSKLFVFDQQKDFHIDVFDLDGNRLKPIKHPYEKIKISESFKKEKLEWLKIQPAFKSAPAEVRDMVYFLEYFPVMRHFLVKDQKIYVETYKTRGTLSEYFVLDLKGDVLKNVFLPTAKEDSIRGTPAANYTFQDNNYYYLVENEDEEQWELHVTTVR